MKLKDPLDIHVGSRVRMQRLLRKLTQQDLADALGLSFQQIQKYEKGKSRIGAARLQLIARTLSVPVAFFFEGSPVEQGEAPDMPDLNTSSDAAFVHRMAAMSDGLRLARAFTSISDSSVRRQIVDIVESLARLSEDTSVGDADA
jgi:transcriptional regulator with XRE-family HTH domain